MLEIKNISKTYRTGSLIQKALNNVSLNLRDNEFVAILGPSGSGKTTLLNIIGGLDRYDEGDLIINHISTKKYKDRDWDSYRNHTIGFVFQSYNLIPHQTVLVNVEMALTISGISRKERKQRAMEALDKVGLKGQEHKKPNQMSGGQMQRVAIARALVNNPDILLADEPTGALDTKTSVQIMDLLKDVAKDRLVVMVSHNPELAEEYATRIVKIRDGQITDDSDPYVVNDDTEVVHKNLGKAKMGYLTALSLSFNNLLSKKGRTILTAFAGSIGIIGIALILALSTGFQNYIDKIQEDTMSSYPLTIQKETSNVFGALLSARIEGDKDIEEGKVKEQMMISSMMNSVGSNDLTTFKEWLEKNEDLYKDDVKNISYSYSVSPRIYTKDVTDSYVQLNPNTIMSSIYSDGVMSMMSSFSSSSSMGTFSSYDFDKLPDNCELITGSWPKKYNDVMIILSEKGKISDLLVYSLGLRDNKELKTLITDVMSGEESTIKNEPMTFTYEDLMKVDLKLVNVSDLYKYNDKYDTYENMSDDKDFMADVFLKSETLNITGVAVSNSDSNIAGVVYSSELVGHVIDIAKDSPIVLKQLSNKDVDVFSGKRFDEKEEKAGLDFNDMVSVDEDMLKNAFKVNGDFDSIGDEEAMKSSILKNSDSTAKLLGEITPMFAKMLINLYQNTAISLVNPMSSLLTTTIRMPLDGPIKDNYDQPIKDFTGYSDEFLYVTKEDFNKVLTLFKTLMPSGSSNSFDEFMDYLPENIFLDDLSTLLSEANYDLPLVATFKAATSDDFFDVIKDMLSDSGIVEPFLTITINNIKNVSALDDDFFPVAKACRKYGVFYPIDRSVDIYKSQVLSDDFINPKVEYLNSIFKALLTSGGNVDDSFKEILKDFTINKSNLKKIISDSIDNSIKNIKDDAGYSDGVLLGKTKEIDGDFITVSQPPTIDVEASVNESIINNGNLIIKEASDSVSSPLVMVGIFGSLQEVMTPITDLFSDTEGLMSIDTDAFAKAFNFDMDEDEVTRLMTSMMTGSSASYSNNLINLGFQDENDPTSISFYFNDFSSKENFLELLKQYNENAETEEKEIQYTDVTGMLISSVQTIVNAVTYVLIAFVSISLVVSSIMIAIITLISVMERTKEIGILRAMGASKHNVSSIFNAETFIIGLLSGVIGVTVSWAATFPINKIIHDVTDINDINSVLELRAAIALIIISVVLTMIAGFIPSKKAAKQDPVIALRSE